MLVECAMQLLLVRCVDAVLSVEVSRICKLFLVCDLSSISLESSLLNLFF